MAYDPSKWYSYSKERSSNGDVEEIIYNVSHSEPSPQKLSSTSPSKSASLTTEEKLADVSQQIKEKEHQIKQLGSYSYSQYRHLEEGHNKDNHNDVINDNQAESQSDEGGTPDIFGQIAEKNKKFQNSVKQIQKMLNEVPGTYRKKFTYDVICDLAQSLQDRSIFEIKKGLEDIQQLLEKNLLKKRMKIINEQRARKVELIRKHKSAIQLCTSRRQTYQIPLLEKQYSKERRILDERHEKELLQIDQNLVLELDQQVIDQQATLQRAGLPLFGITVKPEEIRTQMYILDFISRLAPK